MGCHVCVVLSGPVRRFGNGLPRVSCVIGARKEIWKPVAMCVMLWVPAERCVR